MKWSDLDGHSYFGFAKIDPDTGLIQSCNSAFSRMLSGGESVVGSRLLSLCSADCLENLRIALINADKMGGCMVRARFSRDVIIELNLASEGSTVFAVAHERTDAEGDASEIADLRKKNETLTQKVIDIQSNFIRLMHELACKAGDSGIAIHTTNVTGNENQSIQGQNVKDVKK